METETEKTNAELKKHIHKITLKRNSHGIYGSHVIRGAAHNDNSEKEKGGELLLKNNIWLAPLAGVTDLAFRLICKQCGDIISAGTEADAAPGLVFTEMISAKGLHYKGNNSIRLAASDPRERPLSVQIFGSEPEIMAESAQKLCELGADAIDINMGCPMPKITSNSEGSALLMNPALIENIVREVSNAVSVPVTVKIRRGFETGNEACVEAALAAEAGGAAAITVHGRYRDQYYSGKCDQGAIARVKSAVKIPVIGNGDITSAASALEMFENTGCDGIMIGRAALGRPWIFYELLSECLGAGYNAPALQEIPAQQELHAQQKSHVLQEIPVQRKSPMQQYLPAQEDILKIIRLHIEYAAMFNGEERGIREMRKHLAWYTKGLPHAAEARDKIFKAKTTVEAISLVQDCLQLRH